MLCEYNLCENLSDRYSQGVKYTFWSLDPRRECRLSHTEISDFDHKMTEVFDKDKDNEKQNIRI